MAQQVAYQPYANQAHTAAFELKNYPLQPPPSNSPSVYGYQQPPQQHAYSQHGQPTAVTSTDQSWDEKNNVFQQQAPAKVDDYATTQPQSQDSRRDDSTDEKQREERVRKLVEEQLKPYVEGLKQSQAITKKLEEGYTPKDITGVYNGGSYLATNNDSGSLLTVKLGGDVPLIAKPGAMVAMDPSMNLRGQLSFSWMKLLTRSGFGKSKITGNGEVMLAPSSLGSIGVIRVNTVEPNPVKGRDPPFTSEWKVGRDAFLAATHAVDSDYQTQNLLQAVFSGEGFFVYTFRGWGPLFVQGLGGVIEKEIADGETFTIDNGYLVAWNCQYKIERVASGGIISGISSREGLACRFMGPGTVFYQTRKIQDVAAHLKKANR